MPPVITPPNATADVALSVRTAFITIGLEANEYATSPNVTAPAKSIALLFDTIVKLFPLVEPLVISSVVVSSSLGSPPL